MDFLTQLLGGSQPAPQAAPTQPQNYADFVQRLLAAAAAQRSTGGLFSRSIPNRITGADAAAQSAAINTTAPSAWQQFQQGQASTTNAQLGTAQNLAMQGAMANNTPIDPNNVNAAIPAMQSAFAGSPQPSGGAPADPLTQQRAFYDRMGMMFSRNPATASIAKDFFALRDKGIPDGTTVLNGQVVDATGGKPITTDVGTLQAGRAGQKAAAEEFPKVQGTLVTQGNQAALDRVTKQSGDADQARYDQVTGFDKTTGQPTTVSKADFTNGRTPNFVAGDNPYFGPQQAELKDLRTKSDNAEQAIDMGTQIANAANGIFTGKGAMPLQEARKLALLAGELTGQKPSDAILNDTSHFEQLRYASQQLAAVAAHNLSARTSNMLYGAITAVKPGDVTSMKGLRDIIVNEVIPDALRSKAIFGKTSEYYKTNPTSSDAAAIVPNQNPLQNFRVKSYPQQVNPGDYFLSRHDGTLKQAPVK